MVSLNFTIEYLSSFMYPKGVTGNAHFLTYFMTVWPSLLLPYELLITLFRVLIVRN